MVPQVVINQIKNYKLSIEISDCFFIDVEKTSIDYL